MRSIPPFRRPSKPGHRDLLLDDQLTPVHLDAFNFPHRKHTVMITNLPIGPILASFTAFLPPRRLAVDEILPLPGPTILLSLGDLTGEDTVLYILDGQTVRGSPATRRGATAQPLA